MTSPILLARATQGVINYLAAISPKDPVYMADLYRIVTLDGTTLYYTNLDIDLASLTFTPPGGPVISNATFVSILIERGDLKLVRGLKVDDLSITIHPRDTDLISGLTMLQALSAGLLDGAMLQLMRAYFSSPVRSASTLIGAILKFSGNICGDPSGYSRSVIPLTIKAATEILSIQMPRNVYQSSCRYTLYQYPCLATKTGYNSSVLAGSTKYSINCGLAQTATAITTVTGEAVGTGDGSTTTFQLGSPTMSLIGRPTVYLNGVVTTEWSISPDNLITFALTATPDHPAPNNGVHVTADYKKVDSGFFDLGTVMFTSGPNNGISRTVKDTGSGFLNFALPWPYTPAIGNTFTAYPGCDRQVSTCETKFSLGRNYFGGEPYVPVPESAY